MKNAVFFDRDGVINRPVVRDGTPHPPEDASQFDWMEGVHGTLEILRNRGYLLFVITNQPDVARGTQSRAFVESLHQRVRAELPITAIYTCFHDDVDGCSCRKPKAGLIYQARGDYSIDLSSSWVVGDRWRDIEAGRTAGCRTIYVRHGYRETPAHGYDQEIDRLSQLLTWIR